ncbi:hypothetical protein [Trueperella pyogenes]
MEVPPTKGSKVAMKGCIKTRVVALALAFATTLLSGCANEADRELNVEAYEWAIFISNSRNRSFFPRSFSGHVALVRGDGTYDLIDHSGMDAGKISWSEHGINFADTEGDHWITTRGHTVVKQDRIKLMNGLVTLSDGVTRIGVYNGGFHEDGYREDVVVARPDSSEHHTLTTVGFYPMISACGDDVYGAYSRTPEDGEARFIFDQIVKDGAVEHVHVGTHKVPFSEFSYIANDSPCAEGRIYFLGHFDLDHGAQASGDERLAPYMRRTLGGDDYTFGLVAVDVRTGELDWLPLTTADWASLGLSPDDAGYSVFDAHSLDHVGNFVWLSGNGVLYRTDVETGQTTVLSDELKIEQHQIGSEWLYHFSSDDHIATVLVENTEDRFGQPRIVDIDKTTGKIVKDIRVNGLKNDVSGRMHIWDVAHKPR